jgi:hypothetical protein
MQIIGKRNIIKLLCGLIIIVLLVGSSEKLYYSRFCKKCNSYEDYLCYRILNLTVYTKKISIDKSLIYYLSEEMGINCTHEQCTIIKNSIFNGLHIFDRIDTVHVYNVPDDIEMLKQRLRLAQCQFPHFKEEFEKRIMIDHDADYYTALLQELRTNKPGIAMYVAELTDQEINQYVVENIKKIEWLDIHIDGAQKDESARAIFVLGKRAVPYIVNEITNEDSSQWLNWATCGDVSHYLLMQLLGTNWPTSEFIERYKLHVDDNYNLFHKNHLRSADTDHVREIRKYLQEEWRKMASDPGRYF